MKKDIRDLFKKEEDLNVKLPQFHRQEFLEKLNDSKRKAPKALTYGYIYKMAAALILLFAIGSVVSKSFDNDLKEVVDESTIEKQMKNIEKGYVTSIDNEWKSFLKLTKDEKLIDRYEKKLSSLDTEYRVILETFKNDNNNVTVIEELIGNLQTRLKLLKDIQAHIKLLNKNRKENETITI